jgi:Fur family zinc uptake transcriptional regulator
MTGTISRAHLLQDAEAACLRRGARLTPLRRQVLELILDAEAPVGAYALLDRLKAGRPGAAPPTIYRALDFLLEHGLIHKVERLNAFIGCADASHGHLHAHGHPHQFLICRRCGTTIEIADEAVAHAIAAAASRAGFAASEATVEVEGTCARCAAA